MELHTKNCMELQNKNISICITSQHQIACRSCSVLVRKFARQRQNRTAASGISYGHCLQKLQIKRRLFAVVGWVCDEYVQVAAAC